LNRKEDILNKQFEFYSMKKNSTMKFNGDQKLVANILQNIFVFNRTNQLKQV